MRADGAALTTIKAAHTLAWLSIESCMVYVLYTGFRGKSDRRTAVAASVVAGETVLFAANGCRCPLTDLAERLGAESGSVTDIYLPDWFARNLPAIHVPLLMVAVFLHRGSIRACVTGSHAMPAEDSDSRLLVRPHAALSA